MYWCTIKLSEIGDIYDRSVKLLKNSLKTKPVLNSNGKKMFDRIGWHQFIGAEKVGDVATGQGLLVFDYTKKQYDQIENLLKTLIKSQQNQDKDDKSYGSWSFLTARETPTVDATVWPLLGLLAADKSLISKEVAIGKQWITDNRNPDGGWGPFKGIKSRLYHTFLACYCLSEIDHNFFVKNISIANDIKQWVVNSRNSEGLWGMVKDEETTPIHTAFAIYVLSLVGQGKDCDTMIRSGANYIFNLWDPKFMWEKTFKTEIYHITKEIKNDDASTRIIADYFPTAKICHLLLKGGIFPLRKEIYCSIKWLISSQNSRGSWTLRDMKPDRLWAIHDAILAIKTFIDKVLTPRNIENIYCLEDFSFLIPTNLRKRPIYLISGAIFLFFVFLYFFGALWGLPLSLINSLNLFWVWTIVNWVWTIVIAFAIIAVVLGVLKILTWKQVILGMLIPLTLAIISAFIK